jgi:NitT/TauT family transport system substrate-binding protein
MTRTLALAFAGLLALATTARAETIRIAIGTQDTTINTVHAGLIIRELKLLEKYLPHDGKYKGAEFDIVWKNFTSGPPLTGEMVAGKLDIGALGDFPSVLNAVAFQQQKNRSVYVAALSYSAIGAGNGLVVPSDSPVQTLKDLKGKQISVPFGSAAHGMLLRAIRALGWDPERDVSLVSQAPEVGGSALKSHKIDAHADFVPFAELFPYRGYARKIYDGSTVGSPTSHGVVARGEFVDRYPELVVAFLKAAIEADRLLRTAPEKQAELVQKVAGVDAAVVYMFHGPLAIQTRDFTVKPAVRSSLKLAFETLKLLKRTDGELDVDHWIDERFIRRAFTESGLDYDAQLARFDLQPLAGKDARSGEPITDQKQAAQIWVEGESVVRPYATVDSALLSLNELQAQHKTARVVLVHDAETGTSLQADKVWYVVANPTANPTTNPTTSKPEPSAAFLTKPAATRVARAKGGTVLDYAAAKTAIVSRAATSETRAQAGVTSKL